MIKAFQILQPAAVQRQQQHSTTPQQFQGSITGLDKEEKKGKKNFDAGSVVSPVLIYFR
jgi:hypothetical protein